MTRTPVSLLEQLRHTADQEAWRRFVRLYTPLLYHWARRLTRQDQDAADLVQDVFAVLVQKLPHLHYDPHKRFRGWLWTVLLNKWRDARRHHSPAPLSWNAGAPAEVAGPDPAEAFDEAEYHRLLAVRALRLMQAEFQPTTWKACWEHAVAGRPAAEVARDLGISANAVYLATSRVLSRLRQELKGLLD
jgi:RNA polymerase sigma-70 factor (ECF subfamily)